MKENNIIQEKTYQFAIRIVKLYIFLSRNKKEFVLSKQILRCGTSIGANVEEAIGAYSHLEFLSKITISYKEARECRYWLRILFDTGFITKTQFDSLIKDLDEIIRILTSIQKTTKKNK